MARSSTPTWLPLDRWAEILGIHPIHFNQMYLDLGPVADCGDTWYQDSWQQPNFISREDVAVAIRQDEMMIASELGYFPLPDWVIDERKKTVRPAKPELFSVTSVNVRGLSKSVETAWGYVISGGQRTVDLIDAGATVVATDADGDGYDETCTVTVTTTVTDLNEIRAFYPGRSGSFDYEIRPIQVSVSGGVATITFKRWQIVEPDQLERFDAQDPGNRINAASAGSYETTVDIYRVWNDPQSQCNLLWERDPTRVGCGACSGTGCAICAFDTQTGCIAVRDERLGIMMYRPATWDSDEEQFESAAFSVCRDPEQLRIWYYAGWQDTNPRVDRPRVDLDPYWEKAIVYLSCSLLDRDICSCKNAEEFVDHWRMDLSMVGADVSFQVPPEDLANPFGPARGAIYAWKQIHRDGRAIRK